MDCWSDTNKMMMMMIICTKIVYDDIKMSFKQFLRICQWLPRASTVIICLLYSVFFNSAVLL